MELLVIAVVVGAASLWLGVRSFRFLRRVGTGARGAGVVCPLGCPSCSIQCSDHATCDVASTQPEKGVAQP